MPTKYVSTSQAPTPIGPYSQGVISGGFLFCSGQIALDPRTGDLVDGDVAAQTEQVLQNVIAVLREAKMGPENVVKATVYLADMADFPLAWGVGFRTLPDRRHRVQTRTLLCSPLPTSARTDCRFGLNRRWVTLWAWLTRFPNCGPLPQMSHR